MSTKFLKNQKHTIAYTESIQPKSKIGVIVLHGLAEHKGRYSDFIKQLNDNNISVFAMDLRGHGESGGKRGDVPNFNCLLEDLDCFVKYIKGQNQDMKIILFGHSFGGQICCVYSALKKTDGLILSSPLLVCPPKMGILKIIPHRLLPFIRFKKKHSESAEMLKVSRNDNLSCHTYSLRLVGIMFKDGIKQVNKYISHVNCPTLVLAGRLDPLIKVKDTENAFGKLKSKQSRLIVYDDAKHRIVQNQGSEERIVDIIEWIKAFE